MSGPSFNPNDSPSGPFSPLLSLIRDALQDAGETSPDTLIALQEKRLINCANRVIDDVNRHPYFLDLLASVFTDITGVQMTAGSTALVLPASNTVSLGKFTALKVGGAGNGGGDLITFISDKVTDESLTLADAAETTVTSATARPIFKSRLTRYSSTTEKREIDDRVMIEGILHYYQLRDDSNNPQRAQVNISIYYDALNSWLGAFTNVQGLLEVPVADEDVVR